MANPRTGCQAAGREQHAEISDAADVKHIEPSPVTATPPVTEHFVPAPKEGEDESSSSYRTGDPMDIEGEPLEGDLHDYEEPEQTSAETPTLVRVK